MIMVWMLRALCNELFACMDRCCQCIAQLCCYYVSVCAIGIRRVVVVSLSSTCTGQIDCRMNNISQQAGSALLKILLMGAIRP